MSKCEKCEQEEAGPNILCPDCLHEESTKQCEMCGTDMEPRKLIERAINRVVPVHVCPHCGLVTRQLGY